MPHRRVFRFRTGVLVAGVAAGSLLFTAAPSGQQQVQGRGRAGGTTQTPPTVTVPQIKSPTIQVPDATQVAAQSVNSYSGPWMNPARAEAFMQASRQGLNYLPGEVLVKFKDGVGAEGQTHALEALDAHPTSDSIEWAGEAGRRARRDTAERLDSRGSAEVTA